MVPQIVHIGSPFVQMGKSSISERGVTEVLMDILSNSVLLDPGDAHSLVYRVDGSQGFTASSTACNLGYIEFCWHMVMGKMKRRVLYCFPHRSSSSYGLNFEDACGVYQFVTKGENGSILSEPIVLRPDARHHLEANIPGDFKIGCIFLKLSTKTVNCYPHLVEVCVTSRMPDSLRLGETCSCRLTVTNWTESSMCLQLQVYKL